MVRNARTTENSNDGGSMGSKWNRDVKPSERLLALYSMLLFSGRTVSLTELARELECSKQTVRRLARMLPRSRTASLVSMRSVCASSSPSVLTKPVPWRLSFRCISSGRPDMGASLLLRDG